MIQEQIDKPSAVLVLGMHRSGTSCLAGSLEEAGLYFGDVNKNAPHNARGNRENRAIMDLHDDILRVNGGSWDIPIDPVTWRPEHRARRDAIIAGYPQTVTWGFKDPRTLLTLPGWLEALSTVGFVGTFRHPAAVAASLFARNQLPNERSFEIWLAYNRRLLDYQRRFGFRLVCFDWPARHYHERLQDIVQGLGLCPPVKGFNFFEGALRRNQAPPEQRLPEPVAALYLELQEIAG